MVAVTEGTDYFVSMGLPVGGMKTLIVSTLATANSADTFDVTLANYGAGSMCGIIGWTHTTENSVAIQEQPTTTIAAGVLQVTIGGASNGQSRHYLIFLGPTKNL